MTTFQLLFLFRTTIKLGPINHAAGLSVAKMKQVFKVFCFADLHKNWMESISFKYFRAEGQIYTLKSKLCHKIHCYQNGLKLISDVFLKSCKKKSPIAKYSKKTIWIRYKPTHHFSSIILNKRIVGIFLLNKNSIIFPVRAVLHLFCYEICSINKMVTQGLLFSSISQLMYIKRLYGC